MRTSNVLLFLSAAAAACLPSALAACINACSGHGVCGAYDTCQCFRGYTGGDCDTRACPQGISWFDIPSGPNTAHGYAECSGAGICDRKSGKCGCFEGFSGKACRRRHCPQDCNGHGVCSFMEHAAVNEWNTNVKGNSSSVYNLWDREKTMVCQCDRGYGGIACQDRICPTGDDPLTDVFLAPSKEPIHQRNQIQGLRVGVRLYGLNDRTVDTSSQIVVTYFDGYGGDWTTQAVGFNPANCAGSATNLQNALRALPLGQLSNQLTVTTVTNFYAFSREKISNMYNEGAGKTFKVQLEDGANQCLFKVSFPALPGATGEQYKLVVDTNPRGAGSHPRSTGIVVTAVATGVEESFQRLGETFEVANSWNVNYQPLTEKLECSGRGNCNYDDGTCDCFSGYKGLACETQDVLG